MNQNEICLRILALRAEIKRRVKREEDLTSEGVVELSRELDKLIVAYYKCKAGDDERSEGGSRSGLHGTRELRP